MKYATIQNNYPRYAPRKLLIDNSWVYNPTDEMYLAKGYLPITYTEPPTTDEQHYASATWTEQNGAIVQAWEINEIPIPDEATESDYITALQDLGVEVDG